MMAVMKNAIEAQVNPHQSHRLMVGREYIVTTRGCGARRYVFKGRTGALGGRSRLMWGLLDGGTRWTLEGDPDVVAVRRAGPRAVELHKAYRVTIAGDGLRSADSGDGERLLVTEVSDRHIAFRRLDAKPGEPDMTAVRPDKVIEAVPLPAIQIEAGKCYWDGSGRRVGPFVLTDPTQTGLLPQYVWRGERQHAEDLMLSTEEHYTDRGKYDTARPQPEADLVAEVGVYYVPEAKGSVSGRGSAEVNLQTPAPEVGTSGLLMLEVGKYYRNRKGCLVGPIKQNPLFSSMSPGAHVKYPFCAPHGDTYTSDGRWFYRGLPSLLDLVAEVPAPAAAAPEPPFWVSGVRYSLRVAHTLTHRKAVYLRAVDGGRLFRFVEDGEQHWMPDSAIADATREK